MTLIGHFISQQEIRHKFGEGQKCTKLVDSNYSEALTNWHISLWSCNT